MGKLGRGVAFALAAVLGLLGAPVRAAADSTSTFGKLSVGASCAGSRADYKRVNQYTVPVSGVVSTISLYLRPTLTAGTQTVKGILYADSSGSPGLLVGTTNELVFSNTSAAGWYTMQFASPPSVAAGNYWLGFITGATANVVASCFDGGAATARATKSNVYVLGPSSPFGTPGYDNQVMSIYATYTLAGGLSAPSAPTNVTATPGDAQVALSWGASTDVGGTVAAYAVFRDGAQVARVSSATSYTDTGLVNGTLHSYYVVAYDTSGVRSPASNFVSAAAVPAFWYGTYAGATCLPSSLWSNLYIVGADVSCVPDPLGSGQQVTKYSVDSTASVQFGRPRDDTWSTFVFAPGMDEYVSVPTYTPTAGLPSSIQDNASSFLQTSQLLYPGDNSRPQFGIGITTSCSAGGNLRWEWRLGDGCAQWLGPAVDDRWHTIIAHYHFETCGGCSDGSVQLWYDGVPQTFRNGQTTLAAVRLLPVANDGVTYNARLDLNQYRATAPFMSGTYTLYHGAAAIGPTYASVAGTVCCNGAGP